jgi:hypothetical protein
MAALGRIAGDERSAIRARHAGIASMFAAVGVGAGIFLTVLGSQVYEQSSHGVLWALAAATSALG